MLISFDRRIWPEAVFHVLAHAPLLPRLPSSVHAPRYVSWAAQLLGSSEERELAQDVRMLAQQLDTHTQLARVQALAWLFTSGGRALACADRTLAELTDDDVDRPELLPPLIAAGVAAETLRDASTLELPHVARLPAPQVPAALATALDTVSIAAPWLTRMRVAFVRPLGFCGRVFRDEIWLGTPLDDGLPDAEQCAFQAAHEATVAEVASRARASVGERQIEQVAIVQLFERAKAVGLEEAHARWYGRLVDAPSTDRAGLGSTLRAFLD